MGIKTEHPPVLTRDAGGAVTGMVVRLPFPPTVNHYYRNAVIRNAANPQPRRARIRTPKAMLFRDEVALVLRAERYAPLSGRLRFDAVFTRPDYRARDLDNLGKGLLDALQAAKVFLTDEQIVDLRFRWSDAAAKPGHVVVTVEQL